MLNILVNKLGICAAQIILNVYIWFARFSIPLFSGFLNPFLSYVYQLTVCCLFLFQPWSKSLLCHFVTKIFYNLLSSPHFTWAPNMSTCLPLLAALNPVQWTIIINLLILSIFIYIYKNVMLEQYMATYNKKNRLKNYVAFLSKVWSECVALYGVTWR